VLRERLKNGIIYDITTILKGKIHFRTTPQKHYMLDKQAKISGESINTIINTAIDRYFNSNATQA